VYIALPNHLHREYAVRAAEAGVHVLCEKPMALNEADCVEMIGAAQQHGVKLMVAYRLHFEAGNLQAIEIAESGRIGEPRIFNSVFTMQVEDAANYRLQREAGGGPLWDIGIYCVNAARYLFRDEPVEVWATGANSGDPRFREVEEMASAVLRFSDARLATFSVSFGAADVSAYRLVGHRERAYLHADVSQAGSVRRGAPLFLGLHSPEPGSRALGPGGIGRRAGDSRAV
jgi:predicted dehydrogenase